MTRKSIAACATFLALTPALPAQGDSKPGSLSDDDRSAVQRLLATSDQAVAIPADLLLPTHVAITPSTKGDPMALPFLVDEYERTRLVEAMETAYAAARNDETLRFARYLAQTFPASKEAARARTLIDLLDRPVADKTPVFKTPEIIEQPVLPALVSSQTRTILYDSEDPMVQVGFDFYREGQALRDAPNTVVKEIRPGEVVYRVSNEHATKDFTVALRTD